MRPHRLQTYAPIVRGLVTALVVVLGLVVARDQFHTPPAVAESASQTEFSAARAMEHVEAIAVAPRPQGSEAAAAALDYIVDELEALGLTSELQTASVVRTTEGTDAIFGATVVNVLARIPGTNSTGAIVVNAHYDSGPNALGAGDCGACVGAVLETARALLAGPQLRNDVILLFADGEETQLFGGYAFMQEHPWAADVAFALNLESQGSSGPAVFYVSSPRDATVAARVISHTEQPAAWSYLSTLVRELVGGSDLDSFTDENIAGAGVAFFDSEQYYHTPLDSPQRLNRGSLQHFGDYALGVVRGLGGDDLTALDAGGDGIYFTLWRGTVLRYPGALVLPLAFLATLGFAGSLLVGRRRGILALRRVALAAGLFAATLLLAVILTSVLWQLVRITNSDYQVFLIGVSHEADRFLLAFVALTVAFVLAAQLWGARRLERLELAAGALAVSWLATALTALLLPTFSPLFTWPLLVALAVFGFSLLRPAQAGRPWARVAGFTVIVLPTMLLMLPALLLFQTLGGRLEALLGIPVMGLPILMAAMASALVLPFLPLPPVRRPWMFPAATAAAGLALIAWTSATSGFDAEHPKPNMVMYQLDSDSGSASWLTTGGAGLGFNRDGQRDAWTSQFLGDEPELVDVAAWSAGPAQTTPGYRAAAPVASLTPPRLDVLANVIADDQRTVRLRVTSPRGATNLRMHLGTAVAAASIDGIEADVTGLEQGDGLWIQYLALPPEGIELEFTIGTTEPLVIELHDWSQGLPQLEGFPIGPRPEEMMPSAHDLADTTMVRATYEIE